MDIGIIGGADGPTSIFVAADPVTSIIALAAVIIIAMVLVIR